MLKVSSTHEATPPHPTPPTSTQPPAHPPALACVPACVRRLGSLKKAADASGRKLAFIGMSLHMYLEAAYRVGQAPFSPREVLSQVDLDDVDPNELLIVTTGSQVQYNQQWY